MPLTIKILCIGKMKERFYSDAIAEFVKRLSRYAQISVIELADEKAPEKLNTAQREQVKAQEGERILAHVKDGEMLIALDGGGAELKSEELSAQMEEWMLHTSHICFTIGGSLGLSDAVKRQAHFTLSFGKLTYSHQIFRIMLLEQLYRAFRIMRGEPYHK